MRRGYHLLGINLIVKSTGTNPRNIENPVEKRKDKTGEVGKEQEKQRKFSAIILSSYYKKESSTPPAVLKTLKR